MKHTVLIKRFITTYTNTPIETSSELYNKLKYLVENQKGHCQQALSLFKQLHQSSCINTYPITPIIPSLIKASSFLHSHNVGLQLHCFAIKTASFSDLVVSNSLVTMHAKMSDVKSARQVFDEMPHRDHISWNSMINCYVQNGCFVQAIESFKRMYCGGYFPKPELIASVMSVCSKEGLLRLGREIHGFVVVSGMIEDSVFLPTAIIDLYTRYGDLKLAFRVFDQMEVKNVVSWTAMIRGCSDNHEHRMALDCFCEMQAEGFEPNRVTLISIMPACATLCSMQHGKAIHGYAFRHSFESEPYFSAALVHMYCQYGGARVLQIARVIMEGSSERDVVMWSSIIGSYARNGDVKEAMRHFSRMQMEGVMPNYVTLLAMVSTCTNQVSLTYGQAIHSYALKSGLFCDTCVGNAFISMYSKCGCLVEAKLIFAEMPARDSVSWSTLISAHGMSGCGNEALHIFRDMKTRGVEADSITLLAALTACNHAGLVEEGQELFHEMINENKTPLNIEHYACQIDLLGRAGRIDAACEVVRQMPLRPSAKVWSSLVSACMDHGRLEAAEKLAHELINLEPENAASYTLLGIIYAKANDWHSLEALWRFMKAKGLKKSCGFSKIKV